MQIHYESVALHSKSGAMQLFVVQLVGPVHVAQVLSHARHFWLAESKYVPGLHGAVVEHVVVVI